MKYITQEEFDATVKRLEARRKAVAKAERQLRAAKTLDEKIAANRARAAAKNMEV